MSMISCNGGEVRVTGKFGGALEVVNAARVSYEKESAELDFQDMRLLRFLARNGHMSPFRHASIGFEARQPLMVARQAWRYIVGVSTVEDGQVWNEASRRYVQEPPTFYVPQGWRESPANSKQGSGDVLGAVVSDGLSENLRAYQEAGAALYEAALERGVAAEQARLFLPAYGLLVRWRWVMSWQALQHFLAERMAHDAQSEIRQFAACIDRLAYKTDKTLYSVLCDRED